MAYTVEDAKRAGWTSNDAEAFAQFMTEVDKWVRRSGLGIQDYPDYDWASAFMGFDGDADALAKEFLQEMGADWV